mmetsp:Transcript_10482/g.14805  ORF Transcript_10482/g.14805 Transcript_10482/m.14805 type:complete len:469 (-) Transcript_10482:205-1611(-)
MPIFAPDINEDNVAPTFFPADAERFFSYVLPDYGTERKELTIRIFSTVILGIYLIPYALTTLKHRLKGWQIEREKRRLERLEKKLDTKKDLKKGNNKKKKRGGQKIDIEERKNDRESEKGNKDESGSKKEDGLESSDEDEEIVTLPWYTMPLLNVFTLYGVCLLALTSSNNTSNPRGIFEAPFLSPSECKKMRDIFKNHRASLINDENWRLPLSDSNDMTNSEKEMLVDKLDHRLAPIIERIYGISARAIRLEELFINKISAGDIIRNEDVQSLSNLNFYAFLNVGSNEGSVAITHRRTGANRDVVPDSGNVLIHDDTINSDLNPLKKGESYVMTGKVNIDWVDSMKEYTGVSIYASWLSLSWIQRQFQRISEEKTDRKWMKNFAFKQLCDKISKAIQYLTELYSPYYHVKVVVGNQNVTNFLSSLEQNKYSYIEKERHMATWFEDRRVSNIDSLSNKNDIEYEKTEF